MSNGIECFDGPCIPDMKFACGNCPIKPRHKPKMFYGMIGGTGTDKKLNDGYIPYIIVSAASMWTGKKFKRWTPPKHDLKFIDSGGFSFFSKWGEYPFDLETYLALADRENPDFLATRDYPCEPKALLGKSIRERIDAGLRNATNCLSHDKYPWVTVIQGYRLEHYQYSCEQIKDLGLQTQLMAAGSLCVRKRDAEVRRILRLVRRNFPNQRLHGFGIDLRFLRDNYIRENLWSCDTQAWQFGDYLVDGKHYHLPASEAHKLTRFKEYKAQVDQLLGILDGVSKLMTGSEGEKNVA